EANIMPICLPWGSEADEPLEKERVTITGWGRTGANMGTSNVLNEVTVPVIKNEKCASLFSTQGAAYDKKYPEGLRAESLCAGDEKGNDGCTGDSGGPAVLFRRSRYVLVGIISQGFGCGDPDSPGYYVNIHNPEHLDWINKVAF
ncbi:unnamed protein product, partial [Meganyctiphanes norvegica]